MRPLFLLSSLLISLSSFAVPTRLNPRIMKVNSTGFVTPEARRVETCEVYSDHVLITRTFGNHLVQKENHPVQISSLQETILEALNEPVSSALSTVCDGPTTTTTAEILGSSLPTVVLFESGRCGRPRLFREGGQSENLRDLVDTFCPVTYDPQKPTSD